MKDFMWLLRLEVRTRSKKSQTFYNQPVGRFILHAACGSDRRRAFLTPAPGDGFPFFVILRLDGPRGASWGGWVQYDLRHAARRTKREGLMAGPSLLDLYASRAEPVDHGGCLDRTIPHIVRGFLVSESEMGALPPGPGMGDEAQRPQLRVLRGGQI